MQTIWSIFLLAVAVFTISKVMPQIHIKSFVTAIVVAVVYSVINFLIGWLLLLISLPVIIITFGLFTFVINAFLLWLTDKLIEDFKIDGLGVTLLAALLITLFHKLLDYIL